MDSKTLVYIVPLAGIVALALYKIVSIFVEQQRNAGM